MLVGFVELIFGAVAVVLVDLLQLMRGFVELIAAGVYEVFFRFVQGLLVFQHFLQFHLGCYYP